MAYALVRGEPPAVVIAENEEVLSRVIALDVVAATPPAELGARLEAIRAALLEERWADAVVLWMGATGRVVDAYPDETVWQEQHLSEERVALELRVAPVFRDDTGLPD